MGYITNEKEPELIFIGEDEAEVQKIARMVAKLNADLVDSGFEQYQYDVKIDKDKTYITRL